MHFTDQQKKIIKSIADKKVNNFNSFFNVIFQDHRREIEQSGKTRKIWNYDYRDNIKEATFEFIEIWAILDELGLILTYYENGQDNLNRHYVFNYSENNYSSGNFDGKLYETILKTKINYISLCCAKISPFTTLNDFVYKQKFKTLSQIRYEKAERRAKISQWITIAIAVVSILASVLIPVLNNETQKVHIESIKNVDPFLDDIKEIKGSLNSSK